MFSRVSISQRLHGSYAQITQYVKLGDILYGYLVGSFSLLLILEYSK
jgi:hypothetical protein